MSPLAATVHILTTMVIHLTLQAFHHLIRDFLNLHHLNQVVPHHLLHLYLVALIVPESLLRCGRTTGIREATDLNNTESILSILHLQHLSQHLQHLIQHLQWVHIKILSLQFPPVMKSNQRMMKTVLRMDFLLQKGHISLFLKHLRLLSRQVFMMTLPSLMQKP